VHHLVLALVRHLPELQLSQLVHHRLGYLIVMIVPRLCLGSQFDCQ
jgi:hypothetical protein